MRIFCDFDGTISRSDTTDFVLTALADPAWHEIEARWESGEIDAAECMRLQVAMIGGSETDLNTVLDRVELDPHFKNFVLWAEANGHPITILSDGVNHFIKRLLTREGLGRVPVFANVRAGQAGAGALEQPWMRAGCAGGSGVCKCEVVRTTATETQGPVVFVGDGRSDFCVSAKVDILFAKHRLAEYAAARGAEFLPYETFADVTATLNGFAAVPAKQACAV